MKYLEPDMKIVLFDENVALTLEHVSGPGSDGGIIEEDDGVEQTNLPY